MDFSISLDGAGKGDVEPLAGESIYDRERGNDNRHHIVFRARAERSKLFLQIPDFQHEVCTLPIGRVRNDTLEESERHAREDAEGESATIIVPVLALAYTTPEPDKDQAAHLDQGDRLYVFIDGYLWRELEVADTGFLQDVNLEYVAGRDGADRPATGVGLKRLELPYRVDYYEPEIRIAVSKTPWSWARINSLGGMQDGDFRLEQAGKNGWADLIPPTPEQRDGARERLEQRTQCIDLGDYPSGFANATTASPCADAEGPQDRAARPVRAVSTRRLDEVAGVIYLHDPIRVALHLAEATERAQSELDAVNQEIANKPLFETALLARHIFFNQSLHAKVEVNLRANDPKLQAAFQATQRTGQTPDAYIRSLMRDEISAYRDGNPEPLREQSAPGGNYSVTVRKEDGDVADKLRECARGMDHERIRETILERSRRRRKRRQVREALARQAAYLDGSLVTIADTGWTTEHTPIQDDAPNAITFRTALRDFGYNETARYLELWQVTSEVIRRLNHDPFDTDTDVGDDDIANEWQQTRPGRWFLDQLIRDDADRDPLKDLVFPTAAQLDATDPADQGGADDPLMAAEGRFRPETFKRAFERANRNAGDLGQKALESSISLAERTLSDFAMALRLQAESTEGPLKAGITDAIVRLYKASGSRYGDGLHILVEGEALDQNVLVDGRWYLEHQLQRQPVTATPDSAGWYHVREPSPSVDLSVLEQPSVTEPQFEDLFVNSKRFEGVPRVNRSYVATTSGSSLAREINTTLRNRAEVAAGRLTPIIAVWAAFNLKKSIQELAGAESKSATVYHGSKFVIATGAMATATADAAKAMAPRAMERGSTALARTGATGARLVNNARTGIRVPRFGRMGYVPFINGILAFANAGLATWHTARTYDRGNYALMMAQGLNAVSNVALGVLTWAGGAAMAQGGAAGTLLGLGPWGWAALAAVIVFTVVVELLKKSKIEQWCFYGPFGQGDHRYSDPHDDLEPDAEDDETPETKAHKAHQRLLALLMEPKLELKHARQQNNPGRGDAVQVEAVCHVPGLDVEASSLLLHVEHKTEGYHRVPESIGAGTMQVATVDTPKRPGSDPSHQRLPYFMLKPMTDEETGRVKGVRVRYADEKIVDSNKDHFFAFLTHTTPNGYEIPAPRSDNKQADDDSDRNFLTDRVLV